MARVYLALGSNLGDRLQLLRAAIARLEPALHVTAVSSVYETEPWGITEQPHFLNMAAVGETDLAPLELLHYLKDIERALGRRETLRYGPRELDIDILLYDDQIVREEYLEIPHPRLAERSFVLVPLAELAPDAIHPVLHCTILQLANALPDMGDVKLFAPLNA